MAEEEGPYGRAVGLEMPDIPEAAETVCSWLITAPVWHRPPRPPVPRRNP